MKGFQKFVLFAAIIILIIALVFIGAALGSTGDKEWPPTIADCPDYWVIGDSQNTNTCVNMKDLGKCPPKTGDKHLKMDFSVGPFSGSNEMCAKYRWAKKCGISWDGITYGVQNPCQ